jgi:hypothetical protein
MESASIFLLSGSDEVRLSDTALDHALRRRRDEYLYRQAHPEAVGIARPEHQSWSSAPAGLLRS